MDERVDVEARAAAHEEHRDEEAVADRLDLAPELDVGEVVVRVDDPQQRAGDERAEDRLDPELARERDEEREQQDRDAHAELRRGVLERPQRASRRGASGRLRASRAR